MIVHKKGAGALLAMRVFRQRKAISFYGASVVITGGSRRRGLVIARELAAEGAKLTIMARDTDEVERAAHDLTERGARVLALRGDVRDQKIAQQAIDRAAAHYGRVDVLIDDAGVIQTGPVEHRLFRTLKMLWRFISRGRFILPSTYVLVASKFHATAITAAKPRVITFRGSRCRSRALPYNNVRSPSMCRRGLRALWYALGTPENPLFRARLGGACNKIDVDDIEIWPVKQAAARGRVKQLVE